MSEDENFKKYLNSEFSHLKNQISQLYELFSKHNKQQQRIAELQVEIARLEGEISRRPSINQLLMACGITLGLAISTIALFI